MQVCRFTQIAEFWQQAQEYLLQHEAEHNALLGLVQNLLLQPQRSEMPYLAIAYDNHQIKAIAIRAAPNYLLLSQVQDLAALKFIAEDLQQQPIPGVSGLVTEAEAFAQAWQTVTGQAARRELESRIYQLTIVQPVATASGALRLATDADRPLLLQWFAEFDAEAFHYENHGVISAEIERKVDFRLKQQSLYFWEDGIPVSLAGGRPFSSTAARIAPVYTPPHYRRKGYATACVAALSQSLLDQGCDRCFLFTDLDNPTSNSIYQQIGYHPVCDWCDYSFTTEEAS